MQNASANSIAVNQFFGKAPFGDLQSGYWRGNRISSPYGDDCTYLKDFKNKGDVRALQEGIGLISDAVNLPYVIGDLSGISADWEYSFDYRHFDNGATVKGLFTLIDSVGRRYDIYPRNVEFRVFNPVAGTTSEFRETSGVGLVDGEKYSINVKLNGEGVAPTLTVNGGVVSLGGANPTSVSSISNKFQMHAYGANAGDGSGGQYFINNVNIRDGSGNLMHSWAVNEGDGTTIYDRFGSANGVLTNAVTAIAWGTQDNRFVNYNNTLGYTDNSGIYIPSEINVEGNSTGKDVLGASLEYIGNAPKHAKLKNSFMLTADGVDDQIAFSDLSGITIVSSEGTSTPSINGNNIELTAGTIWNLVLSNGSVFPMAEGDGTIVYDKNALLNGQLENFTLASAWTLQDEFHYNIENGFTQGLYQSAPGICYQESEQAYGSWEWYIRKDAVAGAVNIQFIVDNPTKTSDNGYSFIMRGADKALLLKRATNGLGTTLFRTDANYIENNTWYGIKFTRTLAGEFTGYIKGGAFGNVYQEIDVRGGAGSNPVTDNTHTTSDYFVNDLDAGDGFGGFKKDDILIQTHYDPLTNTGFIDGRGICKKVYIPVDPTDTGEDLTNPAKVVGHNGAETQYQFPLCPELFIPDALIEEYIRTTELITNGNFDTDSNWSKGIGWTISSGTANANISVGSLLSQTGQPFTVGRKYIYSFEVKNYISGTIRIGDASNVWATASANGVYTGEITLSGSPGTTLYFSTSSTFVGSIDNVSVKEVKQGYFFEHVAQTQELLGYGDRNWNVDDLGTRYNICYSNATVNCWRDLIQYVQELTAEQDLAVGIFTKLYTAYETTTGFYLTSDVGKYYVKEI
jgi:hypothetical protein